MGFAPLAQKILSFADFRGNNPVRREKVEMQLFYADWCGHCTRLKPTWEKAAKKGKDVAVWRKMDCTNDRALARRHNVTSFPTIHRVSGTRRKEFTNERTADRIVHFAKTGRH